MRLTLITAAAVAVALSPLVAAFTDTAPFLAFTSRQSSVLDRGLNSRSAASPAVVPRDIIKSLTSKVDELCSLDGLAIVEIENLNPRAFQSLPRDSFLRSRALDAPSQMAFPHVSLNHGDAANEVRHAIRLACQKTWAGKDNMVTLRPDSINDEALSSALSSFSQDHPNNLIVVTSATRKLQMSKRATDDDDDSVMDPKLGLLHRYQFFSTGLLIAILVMVLLLVPAVYFATGLLSGIETPDRLGERSRSSGEKKSQ
ncbi:hypothetical protein CBS101457_005405 [Exobasidium rhododendri]|nr:hypothetical protein CBS101457_005405 [Exobasidium rhododendri]